MLVIDLESDVPIADQIAAGVRAAIAGGDLRPGSSLPSVRQLAGDLGVNLNTVARAYRALEAAGLVVSRRGRGTEVTADRERLHSDADPPERLRAAVRLAAVDARLAGLDRDTARALVVEVIDELWNPSEQRSVSEPAVEGDSS